MTKYTVVRAYEGEHIYKEIKNGRQLLTTKQAARKLTAQSNKIESLEAMLREVRADKSRR